ncbi:MAG: phosphotransferase [Candidatus Micrarchaeota archaeon]|nr:phosphotransferase [Candidatus Micrarchaeota archaeon]
MELSEFVKTLPVGEIKNISYLNKGFQNTIYLIDASKGFFCLRIYNKNKKAHISYEVSVLGLLKGMKVPEPVSVDGKRIIRFNDKYAILYKYIPGKHLKRVTEKQLMQIGEFLAEFHKRVRNFQWNKYRYKWYEIPDWKIRKYAAYSRKRKVKYIEYLPDVIKGLKANRLDERLPKGPIHVDLSINNVLFHNGELSGVLDFDNSYIGPFILDLGKTIMFFATTKRGRFNLKTALILYKAYTRKRKMTKLEYKELYKAIKYAFLSHIFVDYYMRAIELTTDEYFGFIINELYASYKTITLSEKDFYRFFKE